MVARLSTGDKVVGIKQVKRALNSQEVEVLYLAEDSDEDLQNQILDLAIKNDVQVIKLETMKELGIACGIDVSAASAALLKNTKDK